MATARIEAVLWDFGGVFTPSPFHAGRRFAEARGLDFDGLFAAVFGSYHADTDHPWHRVERGEMALADAFAEITTTAQASGVSFDMKELFASMSDDGIDRTIVADKVRALRASGLRMGIVTNNVREFSERWRRLIPVDELFDDIVDSSAVGVRKPNPDIYHLALRRLGWPGPTRRSSSTTSRRMSMPRPRSACTASWSTKTLAARSLRSIRSSPV
jgi:epoxide hydrolase-like predicted phosphatase